MAAKIIFPLSPDVLEIRRVVGDAENLHGKVDSVKSRTDNLPVDTASVLTTIDTEVGNIQTDVTAIKTKTDNLPADTATALSTIDNEVGAIQSDVTAIKTKTDNLPADTATALSNIQTDVDTIDSNVGTAVSLGGGTATVAGMLSAVAGSGFTATDSLKDVKAAVVGVQSDLDNGTDGLGALKTLIDSVQSSVTAIQNNTRLTTSIAGETLIPATGSLYTKYFVNLYDSTGNKEDPDNSDIAIIITTTAGTDITDTHAFKDSSDTALDDSTEFLGLSKLVKDSLGRYYFFYKSLSTDSNDTLNVQLRYNEAAVENNADKSLRIVSALSSSAATLANQELIMGTGFVSSTDSLYALRGRFDTVDSSLSTIDTEVGNIQTDVTAIKAKTDNLPADTASALTAIDGYVDTIETNIGTPEAIDGGSATLAGMLRKLFDDGSGFDATTDSLAALRDALDAKPTYSTSFAGSKSTSALAQSANETMEFSTTEGITTNNVTLMQLKATVTGATTNFTIQIYEKTGSANLLYEIQSVDASGVNIALPSVIFRNADNTPINKVYVKITNVADVSTSVVAVELRGFLNAN